MNYQELHDDDSLLLCVSDLQHAAIVDNYGELRECVNAVAKRIQALAQVSKDKNNSTHLCTCDTYPHSELCGKIIPVSDFSDQRVQIVYEILADSENLPPEGEHWEGWAARRIVDALAVPVSDAKPVAWRVGIGGDWEYFRTREKAQKARDDFEIGIGGKPDVEHELAEPVYTATQPAGEKGNV